MAKLPGLFRRDGIYQLRVVIPTHLQVVYGGRTKFTQSLGTTNRREAGLLGTVHRARTLAHFANGGNEPNLPKINGVAFALPVQSRNGTTTRLSEVYERWKLSKPRSLDTSNACKRAIALYEEFTGDPPLPGLTREQGDSFRAWLQMPERETTSKTARDRLTWVKSVLKYAARDLELIDRSPWEGLDITFSTTNKRRPWTNDELASFFGQPIYTAYELPKTANAGGDASYWIPLIGLYTGARIGEIAQLRLSDVELSGPIRLLSITNEGEGQRVKTTAGIRKVPIHSELIRLGFLDYVESLKIQGYTALWPKLNVRDIRPGDYFGRWFGAARKQLGFGTYPDFHCFRHTVRSQLAEIEVAEPIIDMLIGHEVKGSTGAKVYTHRSQKTLQRAVESLQYPTLGLNRVCRHQRL